SMCAAKRSAERAATVAERHAGSRRKYPATASGSASSRSVSAVGPQSTTTFSHGPLSARRCTSLNDSSSSTPGSTVSSSASSWSNPSPDNMSRSCSRNVPHALSVRPRMSTCAPYRKPSTSEGSSCNGCPTASEREWAGSVDTISVLRPRRASHAAVAAARVVLPTPPFPVNSRMRTLASALDPSFELSQRRVHDHFLGLAAQQSDHGKREFHRQRVRHPGAVRAERFQQITPFLRLLHLPFHQT